MYLKREDLNHTGSHKLNNALGQALLAKRMGKRRIIAETGAGQHGVATATVCALLDLECVVYMGVEDTRRQRPNVQRMQLLGATVEPVDAGARTLKEATSAAIRDWVTNVQSTHYVIGSAVGPAPYPALVRDLQRVIGDEARAQILEREGRLPARVVACVGGGSNAIGIFTAFLADEQVALVGVEAGGDGIDTDRHGAPLTVGGRPGILHGSRSAVMQDEEGQIVQAHSISAGLDYPGAGPQHAYLRDTERARYVAVTDTQALAAFRELARLEGIIPALETAHALAWVLAHPGGRQDGRARPRVPVRSRRQGPGRGARGRRAVSAAQGGGIERLARAFANTRKRAALMPYVMGGFPTLADSLRIGEACVQAGADVIELGMPYSDPLADGPVIHAAGTRALAAGANVAGVLEVAHELSASVPVALMCYANMVFAPGVDAFVERLARSGACRDDRARSAARRGSGGAGGMRRTGSRWSRWSRRRPRQSASRRSGRTRGGSCTPSRWSAPPASARRSARTSPRSSRARRRAPRCRWRSASGSERPSRRCTPPRRARTA